MPIRSEWQVETNGIESSVQIPNDAVRWNVELKKWDNVGIEVSAKSKITYNLKFNQWHHGPQMDMNDIIYSVYFLSEWGSERTENDRTYDSDFTPQASQILNTLKGIRNVDADTIEVYTDIWHHGEVYGVVCLGKSLHRWNRLWWMEKAHSRVLNLLQKISIGFLLSYQMMQIK